MFLCKWRWHVGLMLHQMTQVWCFNHQSTAIVRSKKRRSMDSNNKQKTPETLYRLWRARYRGTSVDQTPPQSFVPARDTSLETLFNPKQTAMPRTAGGERAGASRTGKNVWVGREAPSTNTQTSTTTTTTTAVRGWRQRLAQVRFSRQGNPREERKEGERVARRRRNFWNRVARAHPSMVRVEEEGARDVFRPRAEPSAARQRPWRTTSSLPVWWRHGTTWRPAGPRLRSKDSSRTASFLIYFCNFSFYFVLFVCRCWLD